MLGTSSRLVRAACALLVWTIGGVAWAQQAPPTNQPTADDPGIQPEFHPAAKPPAARPETPPPTRPETPPPTRPEAPRAGTPPTPAAPVKAAAAVAAASGLVIQLKLGTDFVQSAVGGSTMMYSYIYGSGPGLNGSVSFGYRWKRLTLGMGFSFHRFEVKSDGDDADSSAVAFQPTLEYDSWVTYPLMLYITAGLPVGFLAAATGGNPYYGTDGDSDIHTLVGFSLGLGVRYFLHPRFAIGMEAAFRGLWVLLKGESDPYYDDSGETTIGTVSFGGSLFMMAVF